MLDSFHELQEVDLLFCRFNKPNLYHILHSFWENDYSFMTNFTGSFFVFIKVRFRISWAFEIFAQSVLYYYT